ncbi:hypothetical protein L3Y34_010174 [Caenorhabditis briggsae]|uniref:Uncharacterized protein n=1 Tax=Caenorhabditis briggsae TaxID=6238 RepID=A0AAE8ZSW4_CAEBR|nr:hypothetical protein L3Y34_010174 [Caenorhabditis briggsae]
MVLSTSQPTCDKKIIEKILLIVNIIFPSHFDQMDAELILKSEKKTTIFLRILIKNQELRFEQLITLKTERIQTNLICFNQTKL